MILQYIFCSLVIIILLTILYHDDLATFVFVPLIVFCQSLPSCRNVHGLSVAEGGLASVEDYFRITIAWLLR